VGGSTTKSSYSLDQNVRPLGLRVSRKIIATREEARQGGKAVLNEGCGAYAGGKRIIDPKGKPNRNEIK